MWFHLRIIENCNLRCKHCYAIQYDRTEKMEFELFQDVIKTIKTLPKYYSEMPRAYLSGGEPLLHPDFDKMLGYAYQHFGKINILTNGILIHTKIDILKQFKDKLNIQISMEGSKKTNDDIRGTGTHEKIIHALDLLNIHELHHWISYTVSKTNKHAFRELLNATKETGSTFNNVTPYVGDTEYMLSFEEWVDFKYEFMAYAEKKGIFRGFTPDSCGFNYNCAEYFGGLTINPDGSCTGCARHQKIKRPYQDMAKYIINQPKLMNETCMAEKWGDNDFFRGLSQMRKKHNIVNRQKYLRNFS